MNTEEYYWVVPGVEVVLVNDGGVLFQSNVVTLKLEGESARFFTQTILPLLDGMRTPSDIAAAIDGIDADDIANHLSTLADAGVLIRSKNSHDGVESTSLFVGQFVETLGVNKAAAVDVLASMRVVIVGLPDIGVVLADQLAAFGVGSLTLIDPYPLRQSDCGYAAGDMENFVGEQRAVMATRSLKTRWPAIKVDVRGVVPLNYDVIESASKGANFLFGTFASDLPVVQQWVNRAAHAFRIPAMFGQVNGAMAIAGPLVLPEESACFMCWRMRHIACADEFDDAMALEEHRNDRRMQPEISAANLPSIVQTVAGLLATEFLKTTLALGTPSLADAISEYDALKAAWGYHPFLHRPDCPVCRKKKKLISPTQPPLAELKETKAGDVLSSSDQLISNHCGIIRNFSRVHKDITEPEKPYIYRAELANLRFLDANQDAFMMASGKGSCHRVARTGALGEAVERYSSCLVDEQRIIRSVRADLKAPSLDPRRLVLYRPEQYRSLKYQAYGDDTILGWIKARSLGSGEEIYIPALAAVMAHEVIDNEAYLFPITSNGLAAGATLLQAILSGAYEVLERDGFLNAWLHRLPCSRIDPSYHPDPEVRDLCTTYARRNVNLELYLIPIDHPVAIFIGLGVDLSGKHDCPAVVVGLGASLDVATAAKSALFEVAQVRPALRMRMRDPTIIQRMQELLANTNQVKDLADHDLLYAMPEMLSSFDFLRHMEVIDFDWGGGETVKPEACLNTIVNAMQAGGTDLLYCDLTSTDIAPFNLHVVRVIIPDYQPMHFGRNERRLAANRLYEMPRHLGFSECNASPETLNNDPHPLA